MGVKKAIGVTAALAAVLLIFSLVWSPKTSRRVLWVAPHGERVACIRTGAREGHVLVASQSNDKWILRELDKHGAVSKVASGHGYLQSVMPVTAVDWEGRRCLIGLGRSGKTPWSLAECDLTTGVVHKVSDLQGPTAFNLLQPFSSDDRHVVVTGVYLKEKGKQVGCWLADKDWGRLRKLNCSDNGINWITWDQRGKCYVYSSSNGILRIDDGPPPVFLGHRNELNCAYGKQA